MKKFLLSIVALSATAFVAGAQVQLTLEEQLRVGAARCGVPVSDVFFSRAMQKTPRQVPVAAAAGTVRALMRVESPRVLETLKSKGLQVVDEVAGTYIVDVPVDKARDIAATEGVMGFQLGRKVYPTLDRAKEKSHVSEIFAPAEDLPGVYTGSGVVVGIFDGGIDPNHINFQDADGAPRVKALWVYDEEGAEEAYLSPERIKSFKDDEYGTQYESCSHGTHTLGILAGSFTASNVAKDYRGVAIGADIVVCAGYASTPNLLAGLKRMSDYAKSVGKPLVVNMSLGDNIGPHDGTDEFGMAANKFCRENNVHLFISSGNEGKLRGSCIGSITEDGPFRTFIDSGTDMTATDLGNRAQAYGQIEIYSQDETPQQVYLDIIDKRNPETPLATFPLPLDEEVYYQTPDFKSQASFGIEGTGEQNDVFSQYWSNSFFMAVTQKMPGTGRTFTQILLQLVSKTPANNSRYFFAVRAEGTPGKKVFCYDMFMSLGYDINRYIDNGLEGYTAANGNGTINNMACGHDVVAVGSYNSGTPKMTQDYSGAIGDVSDFSSWGETNDGRTLPQICAPGSCIVSSMSSWFASSSVYKAYYSTIFPKVSSYRNASTGKTYYWTEMSGTSMSAPFMAGTAALWLEANPELTTQEIVAIAQETAQSAASELPNWGASGSLNAYAGLKKVLERNGVALPGADRDDKDLLIQPLGDGLYEVFAAGHDDITVEIADMHGRIVRRLGGSGDTLEVSAAGLQPGIYVLGARTGRSARSLKIAVR